MMESKHIDVDVYAKRHNAACKHIHTIDPKH